jgi:sRNA-binding regulator protein Hfq
MDRQHIENLFRRYKGQLVTIRSISGGVYKGHVGEISNDYVLLIDRATEDEAQTFVLYHAIESIVVIEGPS